LAPHTTTRKAAGSCSRCRDDIKAGDAYRWWKFRFGGKRIRCMKARCAPRPSDLTQSKMSSVYAAQENVDDVLMDWDTIDLDDVRGPLEELIDEVETIGEEYQEAADNQRDTFPDSPTADENEERAQQLEEWKDQLEDAKDSLEEFEGDKNDDDEPKDEDEASAWRDGIMDAVGSVLCDCPL
jgi:hypothetical protein